MSSPTQTTLSKLAFVIGSPDCPVLIDVSIDEDYDLDPFLVPSAFRHPFTDVEELVPHLFDREIVVVCQKGKKLSAGVAAVLRTHGLDAKNLEGGNFAWRDAGLVRLPGKAIGEVNFGRQTQWVMSQEPEIAHLACAWLIRRFVDRKARFLFVANEDVAAVADKFSAKVISADAVMARVSQHIAMFEAMVRDFNLETDTLLTFASVIGRESEGDKHAVEHLIGLPELLDGLSRMCKNNLQQLEGAMVIFDALYHWLLGDQDGAVSMKRVVSQTELGGVEA